MKSKNDTNKKKVKVKSLSRVQLFATPWTVAYQAPLSMGFSRQEYWSGLPFLSSGDLPDPGIETRSPTLQAEALLSELPGKLIQTKLYIKQKEMHRHRKQASAYQSGKLGGKDELGVWD